MQWNGAARASRVVAMGRAILSGLVLMACGDGGMVPVNGPGLAGLVLGVEPVPGPDDAGARAETLIAWVGGLAPDGGFGLPDGDTVSLTCPGGTCDPAGSGVQRPGGPAAVLAIVVGNSGSTTAPAPTCTGPTTDPQKRRAVTDDQRNAHRRPGLCPVRSLGEETYKLPADACTDGRILRAAVLIEGLESAATVLRCLVRAFSSADRS